jgi:hypothetical protein
LNDETGLFNYLYFPCFSLYEVILNYRALDKMPFFLVLLFSTASVFAEGSKEMAESEGMSV